MHEVLVNRLGGLSLPRKSVVRLTDRPDMTLVVYRGRKTTMQQCNMQQPGPDTVFSLFQKSDEWKALIEDADQRKKRIAVSESKVEKALRNCLKRHASRPP